MLRIYNKFAFVVRIVDILFLRSIMREENIKERF